VKICGRRETHTAFWWADWKDRDLSEDLGLGESNIKLNAKGIE
jgi:hypothetical protein